MEQLSHTDLVECVVVDEEGGELVLGNITIDNKDTVITQDVRIRVGAMVADAIPQLMSRGDISGLKFYMRIITQVVIQEPIKVEVRPCTTT